MKVIKSIPEFRRRTAPMMDLDFALLDIVPDTRTGVFYPRRLPELLIFCQNNPEYHIISHLKDVAIEVNTVVEGAAFYVLGQGEKDPELMRLPNMTKEAKEELLILEFNTD